MAENHDIVLSLNLTQFSQGITQARIQLDSLAQGARNVAQAVQNSLNTVSQSGLGQGFTQASAAAKTLVQNITNVNAGLQQAVNTARTAGQGIGNGLNAGIQSAGNKAKATATGVGNILGQAVGTGVQFGLAHSIGAISVGANPLTSLPHEIIRNVSVSLFFALDKILGSVTKSTQSAATGLVVLGQNLEQASQPARRASEVIAELEQKVSLVEVAFNAVNPTKLGFGIGLLLLGKILDGIGEKLLSFTENLARIAGEANLSFTQLNAVIQSTGESMGVNLGTTQNWTKFIKDLAITSGTSQKELADFGTAFVQIGANAGLSADELQRLVTIAAFTKDRFRNATEQATNFRQALAGNVRFLQNNIPIGTTLNDVTERYTEILQKQGLTLDEATRQAKSAATAKKVLAVLDAASIPFIKTATETTGSYAIELRKLQGAIDNLKISLGSGIEGVFANATKALRLFITGITQTPGPIQDIVAGFLLLSGLSLTIVGKLAKVAGVVLLVSTALAVLNATLAATTFGNLAGLASSVIGRFLVLEGSLTTLGGVFSATKVALKAFLENLAGGAGVAGLFSAAISGLGNLLQKLGTFVAELATRFLTLGTLISILKIGSLIGLLTLLVDGFKQANSEGSVTAAFFQLIATSFGPIIEGLSDASGQFFIMARAMAAWNIVAEITATFFRILGLAAAAFSAKLLNARIESLLDKANELRKIGDIAGALDQEQKAVLAQQRLTSVQQNINALDADIGRTIPRIKTYWNTLTGSGTEIAKTIKDLEDLKVAMNVSKALVAKPSEEQIDIIKRATKALRSEVDQLNVKHITLLEGEAAGKQAAALLRLKDLVADINDPKKGGGIKLFNQSEIGKVNSLQELYDKLGKSLNASAKSGVEKITSAKQIFDELRKSIPKDTVDDLEKQFNQVAPISASNEALEKQKKLFTEIIGAINSLQDNLIKELATIKLANEFQDKFNNSILGATNNFDDLLRKTQQENEIRRTAIDIEKKIAEIRDKITNGKVEVNDVGTTIRVKLNDQEKAVAQKQLDDLVKTKPAIIQAKIDEASAKRVTDFITEFQKKTESLGQFFADDAKNLRDQADLIGKFVIDLSKGTRFAEDQANIRSKDLDLSNKILKVQNDLLDITTTLDDETNGLKDEDVARLLILQRQTQAYLDRLQAQKASNLESAKEIQNAKNQSDILLSLQKQREQLADELNLIEKRNELFKAHILSGEFDKTKEQIDAVTKALITLNEELIRNQREAEANPGLIKEEVINQTKQDIADLESALRRLSFVNDIKDFLQTIPDAFHTLITDGLSEVISGTKKIKDVLRQFGSDIFKNIADVAAKKAFDSINNGLSDIANKIVSSDIFKSIGDFFGVDIGKGIGSLTQGLKKPQTKEQVFATAVDKFATAVDKINSGTGTTPQGNQPTLTTNPITPEQLPSIDFGKAAQQIKDGTASLEVITEEESAKLWKDLTGQIQFGLQNIGTEVNATSTGVFQDAGKVIEENITGLSTNISDSASKIFQPVAEIIGENATKLESKISDSATGLSDFATKIFNNLSLPDTTNVLATVAKEQNDVANALAKGTSLLGDKFKELGTSILTDINGVTSNLSITDLFGTLNTDLTSKFKDISAIADEGTSNLKLVLTNGIDGCFGTATQSVKDETNALGTVFTDGFNAFSNRSQGSFIRFFIDLGKIISDNLNNIRKTINDAFTKAVDIFFPKTDKLTSGLLNNSVIGNIPIPDNATKDQNPLADFSGSEIFGQFTEDFKTGFEEATRVVDQTTQSLGNTISQGLEAVGQTSTTGFTGFFSTLGTFLSQGISSLLNSVSGLFSGGGDFFSSIFSGIGSLFGFAGGGLIPGTPSKKDNKLIPMASGEGVLTTEAVNFWGGEKFVNALNNMTIPQDFVGNLQASSAPSLLAGSTPTPRQVGSNITQISTDERPIHVTIIDRAPKLDPAAFKMKPSEVTQIFVDGVRKDKVIREVIRDDLKNGAL